MTHPAHELGLDARFVAWIGRRELKSICAAPWTLLGLGLSVAYLWRLLEGYPVVLGRDSIYIANSLAPLTLGGFLAGHAVSSRGHRAGAQDLLITLPLDRRRRLLAEFAGDLGITLLALAFVVGALAWASASDSIGRPAFGELAAGVAAVWAATMVGSAIGHRFGEVWSIIVPLLAILGAAVFLTGSTTRMRWLGPFVDFPTRLDVVEVARRVPWAHAGYLAAIGLLVVIVGVTSGRAARLAVAVPVVIGAVCVWAQLRPATDTEKEAAHELATSLGRHECEPQGQVEICLMPGFEGWRAEIEGEVQRVVSRVPGSPPETPVVLAQVVERLAPDAYPDDFAQQVSAEMLVQLPDRVTLPTYRPMDASTLTALAMWRVGLPAAPDATYLPPSPDGSRMRGPDRVCADNGARPVVAIWAAVEGTAFGQDIEAQAVTAVSADASAVSLVPAGGVELSAEQSQLLGILLADDHAGDALSQQVDTLIRPTTSLARLREIAGVPPPEKVPEYPEWIKEPRPCR